MLICNWCGNTFDEHDLVNGCCPNCGNEEYEEAYKCDFCGEYYADDDLEYNYCRDCYEQAKDDYRHNLSGLRAINDDYDKVEINSLYTYYFDKADIDQILFNELQKRQEQDYADFIEEDRGYFMQQVEQAKEVE